MLQNQSMALRHRKDDFIKLMKRVMLFSANVTTLLQFAKSDIKALQTLGVEIHLACPLTDPPVTEEAIAQFNEAFPKLIWHDVPFYENIYAVRKNHKAYSQFVELLQETQPDLLHCMGTTAGYYGKKAVHALNKTGTEMPCLYTPTDFALYTHCSFFHWLFYDVLERRYPHALTAVIPVCEPDKLYIQKHFPDWTCEDTTVKRLEYAYYSTPTRSKEEMRQELEIPEDSFVLTTVGALRPQKRQRIVIQAISRLPKDNQVHYILCGEGRDREFLERLSERLHVEDHVHFIGYRTDVPDILGASDVFCFPSQYETSCEAALEGMAAGLPLISTRTHGMKYYDEKHEIGAIFLQDDLVDACVNAIQQLSENAMSCRQLGATNRGIAKEYTDTGYWEDVRKIYQKYLELI